MNAITVNPWRAAWQSLGGRFGDRPGASWPRPAGIVCISAHWLTEGPWVTAMAWPRTIHDFGGFPQALFDQRYPAPGSPALAARVAQLLADAGARLDEGEWGLDHGAWSVLAPMFPAADIPVVQLSMDYRLPLADHLALGRLLAPLRDEGVLVLGSGNVVHNLRTARFGAGEVAAYDWALAFDARAASALASHDGAALTGMLDWDGGVGRLAHPSHEHYLPLLYAAGAAGEGAVPTFFNEGFQGASIGMRSVVWD